MSNVFRAPEGFLQRNPPTTVAMRRNIKNAIHKKLFTQEDLNTEYAAEFYNGILVIGYSGGDDS